MCSRKFYGRALVLLTLSGLIFPVWAEGDMSSAKAKAELCFGCHGEDGISLSPEIPNLASQKSEYLTKAIKDFKKGARKNSMMESIITSVPDEDVEEIVSYFSNL